MKRFTQLSKELLTLLDAAGIKEPTQIQRDIIPAIFDNRDVLAQSETGSGKTLSFAIPLIEKINKSDGLCALVLVPTRELCVQVSGEFIKFAKGKHLGITPIYGGVSMGEQIRKLPKTNIIVATPGRLMDLMERNQAKLATIKYLVLDEADRMLDMGFIKDIERILKQIPSVHQSLLFSATISREIERLSSSFLKDPVHVKLDSGVRPEYLQQTYYQTHPDDKLPLLISLLQNDRELALVFCNRKHYASRIAKRLSANGVHARSLHGDLSQSQRERVTNDFRNGKFTVLVATDVAARGLHIEGITHVYNYEIPRDVESYTHRVGRTARAGKTGEAISLVASGEEKAFFKEILFTYKGRIQLKSFEKGDLPTLQAGPPEGAKNQKSDHASHGEGGRSGGRPRQGGRPSRDGQRSGPRSPRSSSGSSSDRPHREPRTTLGDVTAAATPSVEKRAANDTRRPASSERSGGQQRRSSGGSSRDSRGGRSGDSRGGPRKGPSSRGGRSSSSSSGPTRPSSSSSTHTGSDEPKLSWKDKWQKLLKKK